MPSNSGEDKIIRALSNIEKAEILLGGLPKRFRDNDQKKATVKRFISELSRIQAEIKTAYKDELEKKAEF